MGEPMKTLNEKEELRFNVAEKVMGWHLDVDEHDDDWGWKNKDGSDTLFWGVRQFNWGPDCDMNCARLVIERLRDLGFESSLKLFRTETIQPMHVAWQFKIWLESESSPLLVYNSNDPCVSICEAAIAAMAFMKGR